MKQKVRDEVSAIRIQRDSSGIVVKTDTQFQENNLVAHCFR